MRSGLAAKTVHNHILLLQTMLKRAVRWRLIQHNPASDAERPRTTDDGVATCSSTLADKVWLLTSRSIELFIPALYL